MDMKNLTWDSIREYTKTYMWGDAPKNAYPADWELWPEDAHVDEYCWVDHTNDPHEPRNHHLYCCHCGCGRETNGWYNPGHDQKHYGALIREWQMAINNRDRARIIRNAKRHTTDGVWDKFKNRCGFDIVRGVGGKDYFMLNLHTAVTKIGRWYYPVVSDVTGKAHRSTKPIKDHFDADHNFEIEVDYVDVEYLSDIHYAQKAAKESN